jgi:hypothetical protein
VVLAARRVGGRRHLRDAALAVPPPRRFGHDHVTSELLRHRNTPVVLVLMGIGCVCRVLNTLFVTNP